MTPENQRGYTPEPEDQDSVSAHPFTDDEAPGRNPAPLNRDPVTPTGETLPPAGDPAPYADAPAGDPAGFADGPASDDPADVSELGPLFGASEASDFQQRWQNIQAGFVDDPESAVRDANDLTETILTSLTRALEDRRQALGRSARDGDTEQLRLVLRQYRNVLDEVTSL
jgi:hypothetical protein